jgi:alpha-tubulin suppressor-like RCC1 family protein
MAARFILQLIFFLLLASCDGAGGLDGFSGSKSSDGQAKDESQASDASQIDSNEDEAVDPPVRIDGVFLSCDFTSIETKDKVNVKCGLYESEGQLVSAEAIRPINWNLDDPTNPPTDLTTARDAPSVEFQAGKKTILQGKVKAHHSDLNLEHVMHLASLLSRYEERCIQSDLNIARCLLSDGRPLPSKITPTTGEGAFIQLSLGDNHSCGVSDWGYPYCWGLNSDLNRLGIDEPNPSNNSRVLKPTPVKTDGIERPLFTKIASREGHSCSLTVDGRVFCWGKNNLGQLGNGSSNNLAHPGQIAFSGLAIGEIFADIAVGNEFSCGLTDRGNVFCWGSNLYGKLGLNLSSAELSMSLTPRKISSSLQFKSIDLGEDFACAISAAEDTWCWGRNHQGQLGISSNITLQSLPVKVVGNIKFQNISTGSQHVCGVSNGQSICWGSDDHQQNGISGDGFTPKNSPQNLNMSFFENNSNVFAMASGSIHTCAVTRLGKGYCWGDRRYGQLGDGSELRTTLTYPHGPDQHSFYGSDVPVLINLGGVAEGGFTKIYAGGLHSCGVTTLGQAYCWGQNRDGQLGNNSITQAFNLPQLVDMSGVQ